MSTGEDLEQSANSDDASSSAVAVEPKPRLDLDVQISDVGPCKKHLKVTIPRSDVEKQFQESVGNMAKEAVIPGFRPGRAPKQLVEKRFRKEVAGAGQVDPPDGLPGAARRGAQAQPDLPAGPGRRGHRAAR